MDLGMRIDPSATLTETGSNMGARKGDPIEKTAEQFESFLISSMLREFGKAIQSTKKSCAEETQMSLFYEKVGDALAKKGIGIKEMITRYAERGVKVFHGNGENR